MKAFFSKETIRTKPGWIVLAASALAFAAGWWIAPGGRSSGDPSERGHPRAPAPAAELAWTCSMHPHVRQPAAGSCPICGMDLIPLANDESDEGGELPQLRLSERSIALMRIQTAPVQRREAHAVVRLPGRIAVDETRRSNVSAWFAGRVERLFADYTGTRVEEGEHLLEIYSPQLFAAQEEFLQARRSGIQRDDAANRGLAENARERLRLFGLSESQLEELERTGQPTTHLTYNSPADGIVMERYVTTGQYVETGAPLYAVADLSQVWVELEAFESELALLRFGQEVRIEVKSFPGETFDARIVFIDPQVDDRQRTARVRVNLPNEDLRLKPGMLAVGLVRARVGEGGVVADATVEGRWISPMHPEIIKDAPGACDICGMPLVPVEELGYFIASGQGVADPLVIPATAPLHTGPRSLVYVRLADAERPTFEAREVTLGARLGDVYPVINGLKEGELVVTRGQFKIDSELQIRGRPSMMAPAAKPPEEPVPADPRSEPMRQRFAGSVDPAFATELAPLIEHYLAVVNALANDELTAAVDSARALGNQLVAIGRHRLAGEAHLAWMRQYHRLDAPVAAMATATTLEESRAHLQELTLAIESLHVNFGLGRLPLLHRAFCPMVDGDEIGTWLQRDTRIRNPYQGEAMLNCGEVFGKLGGNDRAELKEGE